MVAAVMVGPIMSPVASASTTKFMVVEEIFGLREKLYTVTSSGLESSAEGVSGGWTGLTRCAGFRLQRDATAICTSRP